MLGVATPVACFQFRGSTRSSPEIESASSEQERCFCALVALAILGLVVRHVEAETWSQRPIIIIVPFPAGGGTDAFARPLAAQLDTQLGTRVLIDNRGGAGGTVGASAAAKARPDGYTFFIGGAHHAIAPSLYPELDYDIERDFIPI